MTAGQSTTVNFPLANASRKNLILQRFILSLVVFHA